MVLTSLNACKIKVKKLITYFNVISGTYSQR